MKPKFNDSQKPQEVDYLRKWQDRQRVPDFTRVGNSRAITQRTNSENTTRELGEEYVAGALNRIIQYYLTRETSFEKKTPQQIQHKKFGKQYEKFLKEEILQKELHEKTIENFETELKKTKIVADKLIEEYNVIKRTMQETLTEELDKITAKPDHTQENINEKTKEVKNAFIYARLLKLNELSKELKLHIDDAKYLSHILEQRRDIPSQIKIAMLDEQLQRAEKEQALAKQESLQIFHDNPALIPFYEKENTVVAQAACEVRDTHPSTTPWEQTERLGITTRVDDPKSQERHETLVSWDLTIRIADKRNVEAKFFINKDFLTEYKRITEEGNNTQKAIIELLDERSTFHRIAQTDHATTTNPRLEAIARELDELTNKLKTYDLDLTTLSDNIIKEQENQQQQENHDKQRIRDKIPPLIDSRSPHLGNLQTYLLRRYEYIMASRRWFQRIAEKYPNKIKDTYKQELDTFYQNTMTQFRQSFEALLQRASLDNNLSHGSIEFADDLSEKVLSQDKKIVRKVANAFYTNVNKLINSKGEITSYLYQNWDKMTTLEKTYTGLANSLKGNCFRSCIEMKQEDIGQSSDQAKKIKSFIEFQEMKKISDKAYGIAKDLVKRINSKQIPQAITNYETEWIANSSS